MSSGHREPDCLSADPDSGTGKFAHLNNSGYQINIKAQCDLLLLLLLLCAMLISISYYAPLFCVILGGSSQLRCFICFFFTPFGQSTQIVFSYTI